MTSRKKLGLVTKCQIYNQRKKGVVMNQQKKPTASGPSMSIPYTWFTGPEFRKVNGSLHACAMQVMAEILIRPDSSYESLAKTIGQSKSVVVEAVRFLRGKGLITAHLHKIPASSTLTIGTVPDAVAGLERKGRS
jgi:hypothetical protein